MKNLYWVGSRESDVLHEKLFCGSITRFGSDNKNNYSFCNNTFTDSYVTFISFCTNEILQKDPDSYFIFSNEMLSYKCGDEVYKRTLCLNKLSVIEALNNKLFARNYMSKVVKIPECIVINSRSVSDISLLKSIFNRNIHEFVVQLPFGAGGEETFLLSEYKNDMYQNQQVLVTPYIYNGISINVHIAVTKQDYRIFPPSMQILINNFVYVGSDYIKYNEINESIKSKVILTCSKIAEQICLLGCNGILGIDLIIKNDEVFFIECNYRYQGSSFLLNKALVENGYSSFFEIQYDSFYGNLKKIPDDIYTMPINFSCFRRLVNNKHIKLPHPLEIKKDGADINSKMRNGYIQYEIFNDSIFDLIQK